MSLVEMAHLLGEIRLGEKGQLELLRSRNELRTSNVDGIMPKNPGDK